MQQDPSQTYLEELPIAVQQAFKLIKEREDWTASDNERLSQVFEKLVSMPEFQEIVRRGISNNDEENLALTIQTLAYLRIEQAVYFLKMMPNEYETVLINEVSETHKDKQNLFLAERNNLVSRLETLSKLNMLNRIFGADRREFVLSILLNTVQEID